jgi:glyoxylase-like metal-dependent hydrolase (beta-lactamase superfamily II)
MDDIKIHEIGREFFLIRSGEADFHRNIYAKRFASDGKRPGCMVFDPGTAIDYAALTAMLIKLVGALENLDYIFLSHQDPDVTASALPLLAAVPNSRIITSIDTWRLVKMYGNPDKRFTAIESLDGHRLMPPDSALRMQFIAAYYCHFRGAQMAYDPESGVLFSGDVLGGLNTRRNGGISANRDSWKGIAIFHQIYMPSSLALQDTIGRIGMLPRLPAVIAPQHGDIIEGPTVGEFMDRLAKLDVGIDRMRKRSPEKDVLIIAINEFLDNFRSARPELYGLLLGRLQQSKNFTSLFAISDGIVIDIKVEAREALQTFWEALKEIASIPDFRHMTASLLELLDYFGIYIPFKIAPDK